MSASTATGRLRAASAHKRTLPCQPQTNGKLERLNRTLLDERAYARR